DPQGTLLGTNIERVPNDMGVPADVAAFGTEISYIANAPNIGLQAIVPQGIDTDFLSGLQVDGTLTGVYRAGATLRTHVLALQQNGPQDFAVLTDANLQSVVDSFALPVGGRGLTVTGLTGWPSRSDFGEPEVTPRDLAVATAQNTGITVVPVDANGTFTP